MTLYLFTQWLYYFTQWLNSRRGEGGVGFIVRECIAEEVEFIRDVRYRRVFG